MSNGNLRENSPNSGNNTVGSNSSNEWRTGYIQGNTFSNREVKYRITNGMAIFESDIILARNPKEIERLSHKLVKGIGIKSDQFRWPRGEIPYVIQPTLPDQNRVTAAIRHWEEKTPIRFIQRTDSNASYYPNYVSFIQYTQPVGVEEEQFHCSSPIGMQGWGEQNVILSNQCVTGDVIHEIGHTVGLWHEQSRADRDNFIRIIWENIEPGSENNFNKHGSDGDDIGEYDYCSILHYGAWFFSIDKQTRNKPTIEVRHPERPCGKAVSDKPSDSIGQKDGLSPGDIAAVTEIYSNIAPTVIRNPHGILELFMVGSDRQLYSAGQNTPNSSRWGAYINQSSGWVERSWLSLKHPWTSYSQPSSQLIWSVGTNPAIAQNADGRLAVFMIFNAQLWLLVQRTQPAAGSWAGAWYDSWDIGWYILIDDRSLVGDPVVAQNADGRLEVFVVASDGQLYHLWQTEPNRSAGSIGNWAESFATGFLLVSMTPGAKLSARRRPAIAQNADGRLELFGVGLDGHLYHTWQTTKNNSSEWAKWAPLGGGGPLPSDPVVAQNADGRLEVFVVASNGQLYHLWQTAPNGTWSNPTSLGGQWSPLRRPAIAQNADGRLEMFMVGSGRQLYHRWQTEPSSSNQWSSDGDGTPFDPERWPLSSNPAIARNADGRLEVFMMGSDRQLYHKWETAPSSSSGWVGSWAPLGGQFP